MCGIIGIISEKDVLPELYFGLVGLQHRGQDSAGILSYNGTLKVKKEKGLVEQIFSEDDLKNLSANIAIGHTRYPTIGSDFRTDAQPFYFSFPHRIGIVHNGNITNYFELRKEFDLKKKCLHSTCDVEAILNVFAEALMFIPDPSVEDIFSAVSKVFSKVKGAYSVVALIGGKGLLAFRDPHAIKPLVLLKKKNKENGFAFASESIALTPCGFEVERNLKPGEAVFIDNFLKVHSKTLSNEEPSHCMFEWVYFARPESKLEKKDVYEARKELGRELASLWKLTGIEADLVVPVPDTARSAATILAEELRLPCREGLIKNRYIGRTFIMGSQSKREDSVKLKLNPIISEIKGKKIILVDDSIVRGTTSKKIVGLLKDAGAERVYFLSTCPPIKCPCFYGIDMPLKSELIASNKSVEEIRKFIEADYLLYNTIEGLKKAIGTKELCCACLNGNYPVKVSQETIKEIEQSRTKEREKIKEASK
ncbi:MAG: amidophosphoribosyltransferase [Candidatus Diapherotrites archaeon]